MGKSFTIGYIRAREQAPGSWQFDFRDHGNGRRVRKTIRAIDEEDAKIQGISLHNSIALSVWKKYLLSVNELLFLPSLEIGNGFTNDLQNQIPTKPGVYIFFGKRDNLDKILYVGQSMNLRSRIPKHAKDWWAKYALCVSWIEQEHDRFWIEAYLITTHRPIGNNAIKEWISKDKIEDRFHYRLNKANEPERIPMPIR